MCKPPHRPVSRIIIPEAKMEQFFEDYLDRLQELHAGFAAVLDGLTVEALDWQPGEEMNSLAVLVTHTAGSQRYWIGDIAGQDPSGRVRSLEFEAGGRSAAELLALMDASLAHSRAVLSRLLLGDLARERDVPLLGKRCTVGWALLHALEHTGIHLGHVQIGRQLWDTRAGKLT
jgi:DinB superfamily